MRPGPSAPAPREVVFNLPPWAASLDLRWEVDSSRLSPRLLQGFVAMGPDAGLNDFGARALAARAGTLRSALHRGLRPFLSDFDINGLLDMYPMHLLSTAQARSLLGDTPRASLLDVGAGNGDVTAQLAPLFGSVQALEASQMMRLRLRRRGFRTARPETLERDRDEVDVVACLNVLDRTHEPLKLLRACSRRLARDGRLLLSMPLPYHPIVFEGGRTVEPLSPLPVSAPAWEEALIQLDERVLAPLGLVAERWSRVPYVSGGDDRHPWYALDAVVLACSRP